MEVMEPSRRPGVMEIKQLARVMMSRVSIWYGSVKIGEQAPSLRPPSTSGRQAAAAMVAPGGMGRAVV